MPRQSINQSISKIEKSINYDFLQNTIIIQFEPTGWCFICPSTPDDYLIASNYSDAWMIDLDDQNQLDWLKSFDTSLKPATTKRLKSVNEKRLVPGSYFFMEIINEYFDY